MSESTPASTNASSDPLALAKGLLVVEQKQQEYAMTLLQYREKAATYLATLKQPAPTFEQLPQRVWWGSVTLTDGPSDSANACEALCSETAGCQGATFSATQSHCWARAGTASLQEGTEGDMAILATRQHDLIRLQALNQQLVTLSEEIDQVLATLGPEASELTDANALKQHQLAASRARLVDQQRELQDQLRKWDGLKAAYEEQTRFAEQQSLLGRWWRWIGVLCLVLTVWWLVRPPTAVTWGIGAVVLLFVAMWWGVEASSWMIGVLGILVLLGLAWLVSRVWSMKKTLASSSSLSAPSSWWGESTAKPAASSVASSSWWGEPTAKPAASSVSSSSWWGEPTAKPAASSGSSSWWGGPTAKPAASSVSSSSWWGESTAKPTVSWGDSVTKPTGAITW
jgi:hypothetical protein